MWIKRVRDTLVVLLFVAGQSVASSETDKASDRAAALSKVSASEMIIYPAKNPKSPKAFVTIFTDMDCTYCKKLHHEIPKANELGIEVRYMAYPRHGKGSETYDKMVTVWCSSDPKERKNLMEESMNGKAITIKTCDHKVDDHRNLGRQFELSGTPTIVFENGVVWSGYMPADELARKAIKHKATGTGGASKDARSSR